MNRFFIFRIRRAIYSIPLSEIIYMEKKRRQVLLHTSEEEHLFYATCDEVTAQLDDRFLRCHRSYVINLAHVKAVNSGRVLMSDGSLIILGGKAYGRTLREFEKYLRSRLEQADQRGGSKG